MYRSDQSEDLLFGSYGADPGNIGEHMRLECRIGWYVYDPLKGDDDWQVPPGTPFAQLPSHWICPECDGGKDEFMVIAD